jgi:hypothetical protein
MHSKSNKTENKKRHRTSNIEQKTDAKNDKKHGRRFSYIGCNFPAVFVADHHWDGRPATRLRT